jgi:hypothetical protein
MGSELDPGLGLGFPREMRDLYRRVEVACLDEFEMNQQDFESLVKAESLAVASALYREFPLRDIKRVDIITFSW